jgi:hypothetical protein
MPVMEVDSATIRGLLESGVPRLSDLDLCYRRPRAKCLMQVLADLAPS